MRKWPHSTLVKSIRIKGFTSYTKEVHLDLPSKGITLITGDNGSGKSSWLEAASYAGWGKMLRGDTPWRSDMKGYVGLSAEGYSIKRTNSKLEFTVDGNNYKFETRQQAKEALLRIVGQWDVWRRTSVFSSSDVHSFSVAGDTDRKKLIETLLGMSIFDVALKMCRDDMRDIPHNIVSLEHKVHNVVSSISAEERLIADVKSFLGDPPPVPDQPAFPDVAALKELSERLDDRLTDLAKRSMLLKDRKSSADLDLSRAVDALKLAEKSLDRFSEGNCPTCDRPMAAHDLAKLETHVSNAREAADNKRKQIKATIGDIADQISDIEAARDSVNNKRRENRDAIINAERANAEYKSAKKVHDDFLAKKAKVYESIDAIDSKIEALEDDKDILDKQLAELRTDYEVRKLVEYVLGTKGFRAHLMTDVLSGIESLANSWLAVIDTDLSVSLKPYRENKTGGVADAISLEVLGRGTGSYKSSSAGERRRVDIAVVLALAEMSSAAHKSSGTLWLDELFDSLDQAGIKGVCQVLPRLAEDRSVVVISHSTDLVKELPYVKHYHIDKGVVTTAA